MWNGRDVVIRGQGSGKGRRHVTFCESREEAERVAASFNVQVDRGALEEPEEAPGRIGAMLDAFLSAKKRDPLLRKSTLAHMTWAVAQLKASMNDVPMRYMNRETVTAHVARRLGDGKSSKTIGGELLILRMALAHARRKGWWDGDTIAAAGRFRLPEVAEKEWLRPDEALKFLEAIANDWFRVAAHLALLAGMRSGEIVSRRWGDWDRDAGTIRVADCPAAKFRTKNGKPRVVPVIPELRRVLLAWWLKQGRPEDDVWIVPARDNERRRTTGWFRKKTVEACRKAGVREVSFHELRHSCASLMNWADVDMEWTRRMLGHHSKAFTADHYTHVDVRRMAQEAGKLQLLLDAHAATRASQENLQVACKLQESGTEGTGASA